MTIRHRNFPSRWIPALLAASGLLLSSAGTTSAQPKNDDGADLQKQIERAIKEIEKIAPNDPAIRELQKIDPNQQADLPALRRRLEDVRGQLRGIAPANPFGRRGMPAVIGSRFGAIVQVPPPVVVDQLDLPANKGLVVADVQPDSPAEKAGIRKNDILLEFAGKPVPSDLTDFTNDVREHKLGDEVDAVVMRRGKRETIKGIKLADYQANDGRRGRGLPAFIPEQRIPEVRIENPPGAANALGTNNESMKVRVTSEGFTVEMTKNNVKATLTGTQEKNKGVPQQVRIEDGDAVIVTRDMTQVPEQYRPLLDRMLRSVGAGPARAPRE